MHLNNNVTMKKLFFTFIAITIGIICFAQNQDMGSQEKIKINILMKSQSDAMKLQRVMMALPTKAERREFVVNVLKRQSE